MSIHTFVDADGEVISIFSARTPQSLTDNTPPGATVIDGLPPAPDAHRAAGVWVTRPALPSRFHTWNVATKAWVDARSLVQMKADKLADMRAAAAENDNFPITVLTYEFDADAESKIALYREAQTGGSTVDWTLADNSIVNFTHAEIQDVVDAVHARWQAIHDQIQTIRASFVGMDAADIAAVTWTTIT